MSENIQAWETEDAVMVVWGTHDPRIAAETANAWYRCLSSDELDDLPATVLYTPEES